MPIKHNGPEAMKRVLSHIQKFQKKAEFVAKGVSIQCLADLQQESPVRYGRYRAAHTLAIMEPSNFSPSPPTKEETRGHIKGQSPPLPRYTQLAQEQIQGANDKLKFKLQHGFKIFIVNNLIYAIFIEDGSYTSDERAPRAIYAIVAARYNKVVEREWAKVRGM